MLNLCDVYSTGLRIHVEVCVFGNYISSNIMFKHSESGYNDIFQCVCVFVCETW